MKLLRKYLGKLDEVIQKLVCVFFSEGLQSILVYIFLYSTPELEAGVSGDADIGCIS